MFRMGCGKIIELKMWWYLKGFSVILIWCWSFIISVVVSYFLMLFSLILYILFLVNWKKSCRVVLLWLFRILIICMNVVVVRILFICMESCWKCVVLSLIKWLSKKRIFVMVICVIVVKCLYRCVYILFGLVKCCYVWVIFMLCLNK